MPLLRENLDPHSNLEKLCYIIFLLLVALIFFIKKSSRAPPSSHSAVPHLASDGPSAPAQHPLPDIEPSNFAYVFRESEGIRDSWLLDPGLVIPGKGVPSLSPGETLKNLSLESICGNIDAKIFLKPTSAEDVAAKKLRGRILIHVSTDCCSGTTKIYDVGGNRLPLDFTAVSNCGSIYVFLPRSFKGTICVKASCGSLHYSKAVHQMITTYPEREGVLNSFLGHLSESDQQKEWQGDTLFAELSSGSINIYFNDSDEELSTIAKCPRKSDSLNKFLFPEIV